jgi:hypothetical protein
MLGFVYKKDENICDDDIYPPVVLCGLRFKNGRVGVEEDQKDGEDIKYDFFDSVQFIVHVGTCLAEGWKFDASVGGKCSELSMPLTECHQANGVRPEVQGVGEFVCCIIKRRAMQIHTALQSNPISTSLFLSRTFQRRDGMG